MDKDNNPGQVYNSTTEARVEVNECQDVGDFTLECSKCHSLHDINSMIFVPERQDLLTFLQNNSDGFNISFHYHNFQSLNDTMRNNLTRSIIGRELFIIMKKNNLSLENPLEKLEFPTELLNKLADEVVTVFKEKKGIYYTPGYSDGKNWINSSGKFVQRINYMRKCYVESGLIVYPVKHANDACSSIENTSVNVDDQLLILQQSQSDWSLIVEAWDSTYKVRQSLIKSKGGTDLWEFTEYPCLKKDSGLELIYADFNKKFPKTVNIHDKWKLIRGEIENFISSKNITAKGSQFLLKKLPELKDEDEDAALLQLLPLAIKASEKKVKPTPKTPTAKRRKVDVADKENAVEPSDKNFEEFILRVNVAADLDKAIEGKRKNCESKGETVQPFIAFVGSSTAPESFYVVVDNIKYAVKSAVEAVEATYKIFFSTNCQYPKSDRQVWLFIQRVIYCMELKGDKVGVQLNNALFYFEKFSLSKS